MISADTKTPIPKPVVGQAGEEDPSVRRGVEFKPEIAVVDAGAPKNRSMERILEATPFRPIHFSSENQLLNHIEGNHSIQVVLIECTFSVRSRCRTCMRIREIYSRRDIPVIVFLTENELDERGKFLSCGANDYGIKPLTKKDLLARIETQFRLKRSMQLVDWFTESLSKIDELVRFGLKEPEEFEKAEIGCSEGTYESVGSHNRLGDEFPRPNQGSREAKFTEYARPPSIADFLEGSGGDAFGADSVSDSHGISRSSIDCVLRNLKTLVSKVLAYGTQTDRFPPWMSIRNRFNLTEREIDVFKLVATGHENQEIATTLGIATNTVKQHVYNLFNKVGAGNRTHLVYKVLHWEDSESRGKLRILY